MSQPASILAETPSERFAPVRFLWRADPVGRFTHVSAELAILVGEGPASIVGRSWDELRTSLVDDPDGGVAAAFEQRRTWSGLVVYWAAEGGRQVPVDFAGMPVFSAERELVGFRGFGLVRPEREPETVAEPIRASRPEPVRLAPPPAPSDRPITGGWFSDMRQRLLAHLGATRPAEPEREPGADPAPAAPLGDPHAAERGLSDEERSAFREIARALGGEVEADLDPEGSAGRSDKSPKRAPGAVARNPVLEAGPSGRDPRLDELEASLNAARRELAALRERASAEKADLLTRVAEQTRAPLDAIIAFSAGMLEERLGPLGNPSYKEYLTEVRTSAIRIADLIEDLSEVAKIEAGRVALSPAAVNLNDLVASSVGEVQPRAVRQRVVIRTSLAPDLSPALLDAPAVKQITSNLVSHAVDVSGPGGQVIVSTAGTDDGHVALRIRDGGPGVSEAEIASALEPLAPGASQSGIGFGLSRAKAVVEANGGKFSVSSGSGPGMLIEVTFRAAPAQA